MNRKDFYRYFAQTSGASIEQSKITCKAVFDTLARCIKEEDRVYIKGLGTFKKKIIKAHVVGNFGKEGTTYIPETEKIVFEFFRGELEDGEDDDE